MSLPRYAEYQGSGVEWLGPVPAKWGLVRLKRIVSSIEQGWSPQCESFPAETPDEYGVMKVGCVNGGTFRPSENKKLPEELQPMRQYALKRGDLLISRANTRELVGSAAVVQEDYDHLLLCDKLYRLRVSEGMNLASFLARYLATSEARSQIELGASGASSSMLNIGQSVILELLVPMPSTAERIAIAAFLDRETGKIDALIAEQEKLLTLLAEKRQDTISRAVTRGLNPNAPMKDSGVAWLGEVPAHWNMDRMGALYRETAELGNDDLPILSVSIHDGVSDKELNDAELDRKVTRSDDRSKYKRVLPNDLTYNMMRAWQGGFGSVAVAGQVSPAYVVATPRRELRTVFVEQLLRTPHAIEQVRRYSRGITEFRLRLYWDEFKNIRIALPPLAEQDEILSAIASMTEKYDALSGEAKHAIDLLRERRRALVAAAVTGKIDVRLAA